MTSYEKQRVVRPQEARSLNSALVLRLLRDERRLSRAEISRSTGLSEGTVSRIVGDLMERGLVVEDGAENSTGGRPATRLQLTTERSAMGVDVGKWEMLFATGNIRGHLGDTVRVRTPARPEDALDVIAETFRAYVLEQGANRLDRIGVSIAGIVDSEHGVVKVGHNPQWVDLPVKDYLEKTLGVPVCVENNVRAAALAEYQQVGPDLRSSRCLLYVLVDEGVGVGILMDGKLYHGTRMAAGEFGQMVIAFDDGPQRHDRPGSFEQLVSNSAICDRYAALAGRSSGTGRDSAARVRRICQEALNGDPRATEAVQTTGRYLGVGIANLVWGLDPDAVVISSSLNAVWPMLLAAITDQFPRSDTWPAFRHLRVQQSVLGDRGPLAGATTLAFSDVFQSSERSRTVAAT